MSFSLIEVIVLASFTSLLTISVIQFINPLYDESKNIHVTTRILNFLWGLGAIFILYILFLILNVLPNLMKLGSESNILLSSIGISLSAFIASASVMKNIATTKELKKEEIKLNRIKDLTYLSFLLISMKKDLEDTILTLKDINKSTDFIKETLKSYISLKKELLNKDMIFLLEEDEDKIAFKNILISFETIEIFSTTYFQNNIAPINKEEINRIFISHIELFTPMLEKLSAVIDNKIKLAKLVYKK